MGIRFIDSLLMLLTASVGVFSAYLVGHALSNTHATWAWVGAGLCLVAAIALGWVLTRRLRSFAARNDAAAHP